MRLAKRIYWERISKEMRTTTRIILGTRFTERSNSLFKNENYRTFLSFKDLTDTFNGDRKTNIMFMAVII